MKRRVVVAVLGILACPFVAAHANDRYVEPPPLVVSPDLSAPWVLQLNDGPGARAPVATRRAVPAARVRVAPDPVYRRPAARAAVRRERAPAPTASMPRETRMAATAAGLGRDGSYRLDPEFLPQTVRYEGTEAPGTIIVDTKARHLYFVMADGTAMRYGVGVGKEGFGWSGTHHITDKKEWPGWTPPAEMIARERKKGHILPAHMQGGPANPLGARALYIGSTLYRIHGTNAPWTIGRAVSSGCIRMRNQDVTDLFERVHVGAKVVVM